MTGPRRQRPPFVWPADLDDDDLAAFHAMRTVDGRPITDLTTTAQPADDEPLAEPLRVAEANGQITIVVVP